MAWSDLPPELQAIVLDYTAYPLLVARRLADGALFAALAGCKHVDPGYFAGLRELCGYIADLSLNPCIADEAIDREVLGLVSPLDLAKGAAMELRGKLIFYLSSAGRLCLVRKWIERSAGHGVHYRAAAASGLGAGYIACRADASRWALDPPAVAESTPESLFALLQHQLPPPANARRELDEYHFLHGALVELGARCASWAGDPGPWLGEAKRALEPLILLCTACRLWLFATPWLSVPTLRDWFWSVVLSGGTTAGSRVTDAVAAFVSWGAHPPASSHDVAAVSALCWRHCILALHRGPPAAEDPTAGVVTASRGFLVQFAFRAFLSSPHPGGAEHGDTVGWLRRALADARADPSQRGRFNVLDALVATAWLRCCLGGGGVATDAAFVGDTFSCVDRVIAATLGSDACEDEVVETLLAGCASRVVPEGDRALWERKQLDVLTRGIDALCSRNTLWRARSEDLRRSSRGRKRARERGGHDGCEASVVAFAQRPTRTSLRLRIRAVRGCLSRKVCRRSV